MFHNDIFQIEFLLADRHPAPASLPVPHLPEGPVSHFYGSSSFRSTETGQVRGRDAGVPSEQLRMLSGFWSLCEQERGCAVSVQEPSSLTLHAAVSCPHRPSNSASSSHRKNLLRLARWKMGTLSPVREKNPNGGQATVALVHLIHSHGGDWCGLLTVSFLLCSPHKETTTVSVKTFCSSWPPISPHKSMVT